MDFSFNLSKHIPSGTAIDRAFNKRGQMVALAMPFILAEEREELNIVHMDRGITALCDGEGNRYKIVCSIGKKFNVWPSYTKGKGRSSDGCSLKRELGGNGFNKVMLVSLESEGKVSVNSIDLKSVPKTGIIHVE